MLPYVDYPLLSLHVVLTKDQYWPEPVDCQNICVQVSYKGRSLNLLHIDHSGGAHDISYDAYSILTTGQSADDSKSAAAGGDMSMTYTVMPPSACGGLLYTGKLPLEASNSMDYLSNCLQHEPDSFAAKNYELWNMADSTCTLGVNEKCTLNWPAENDPTCPSQLGIQTPLSTQPTHNVEYPSGKNETITYDT